MNEFLQNATYFGVILTFIAYGISQWIAKKVKFSLVNPMLLTTIIIIVVLLL